MSITTVPNEKHRHTIPSSPTSTPTNADPEPSSRSPSHAERDSAIALGVIVIVVFIILLWYLRSLIKSRQALDIENRLPSVRYPSVAQRGSIGSIEVPQHDARFRADSIWSTCKPSTTREENTGTAGKPRETTSRARSTPSPSSYNTYSRPPCRASSIPLPPNSTHHPILAPRSSPLAALPSRKPSTMKLWWREVARRGSTTRADRRLSLLEPIIESPYDPGHNYPGEESMGWNPRPTGKRRVSEEMRKEVERDMARSGFGRVVWREEGDGDDVRRVDFGRETYSLGRE
jgi:hypothetical protein